MSMEDNVNGSVEFLQREHARTLQGLHNEISKLQQKCAKLTFELTMSGSLSRINDNSDAVQFSKETQQLHDELSNSRETVTVLQGKVETLESHIALLKHEKHMMMRKFEDHISSNNELTNSLHSQLEEKSTTIAQLVHKMHQMQRLLQRGGGGDIGGSVGSNQDKPLFFPQPPRDPPPENVYRLNRIARRTRKLMTNPPPTTDFNQSTHQLQTSSLPTALQFSINSNRLSHSHSHALNESSSSTLSTGFSDSESVVIQRHRGIANFEKDELTSKKIFKITRPDSGSRHTVSPPSKQVLPPIRDEITLPPIIPLPTDPKPKYHRRFHLAKTQGLTSAPCSLRLGNYSNQQHKQRNAPTDDDISPSKEGRLLVKHSTTATADSSSMLTYQQEYNN